MASDSLFRIYSMTKPLVAVGAMMLVEEGKIQLTDPVSKFLPAFKGQQVSVARPDGEFAKISYMMVPADREITIQDLFRHTCVYRKVRLCNIGDEDRRGQVAM